MRLFPKIMQKILVTGLGIIALLAIIYIADFELFHSFDQRRVGVTESFALNDSIVCHVQYSTHRNNRGPFLHYMDSNQFALDNLNTDKPTINGFEIEKSYMGTDYITLRSKAIDRFSETISIMTKTGQFTRSVMGTTGLYGDAEFPYVVAQKGRCE